MQSDLLAMKNLGNTSINWLHAIGINSYQDLREMGAVNAYIKIKRRGIRVSKVLLYALQGALMDIHWNDLPPDMKQQLLTEAQQLESQGDQ